MPKISFVHTDNSREDLEVPVGTSIMHAFVAAGLDGIVGECGGSAMCATCHVYLSVSEQSERGIPPRSAVEEVMLESAAAEQTDESRLGCQISVTDAFDGLVIRLPVRQL